MDLKRHTIIKSGDVGPGVFDVLQMPTWLLMNTGGIPERFQVYLILFLLNSDCLALGYS